MIRIVMVNATYRNKKTGNPYIVIARGKHSETQEEMVVYKRYDIDDDNVWIRPLGLFKEKFEIFVTA